QDWYDFVYAMVSRYKGSIKHWGMWNEPNLSQFWTGSRAQYVNDILVNGARAAKAADPDCVVCGPELALVGDWYNWLHDALVTGNDAIDVITQHVYKNPKGTDEVLKALDGKPSKGPSVKWVVDQFGRGQEVWLTECGWHTD